MQREHQLISYAALLSALQDLCSARQTGTMFIGTSDNHSARFTLNDGEIVACGYGARRGPKALAQVREISSGKYSFTEAVFDRGAIPRLPPTEEVLSYLGVTRPESVAAFTAPQDTQAPLPDAEETPDSVPITIARSEVKELDIPTPSELSELLQTQLAMLIGPLGPAVCAMHEKEIQEVDDVDQLAKVIETIADEIGDPAQAQEFRTQVWSQLT